MKLHPMLECMKRADELIEKYGGYVLQQFNCAKCGEKQTMDVPNAFFTHGICERCGAQTDIEKDGCNYMLHIGVGFNKEDEKR
jgi:rRNA maturation protein Nop10